MGKASRDKGNRGERELVARIRSYGFPAEKVSAMYKEGHDVEAFGLTGEVKRYQKLPCQKVFQWMRDVEALYMREDLGEWFFMARLPTLADMLDEAERRGYQLAETEYGIDK